MVERYIVERYIKEYADACKREIKHNTNMQDNVKNHAIEVINNAIKMRDRGLITADEAVKMILERYKEG